MSKQTPEQRQKAKSERHAILGRMNKAPLVERIMEALQEWHVGDVWFDWRDARNAREELEAMKAATLAHPLAVFAKLDIESPDLRTIIGRIISGYVAAHKRHDDLFMIEPSRIPQAPAKAKTFPIARPSPTPQKARNEPMAVANPYTPPPSVHLFTQSDLARLASLAQGIAA